MKAKNIDAPSEKPMQDWSDIASELDKGDFMSFDNDGPSRYTTWLTTINKDGSPHVTAVGAVWDGDNFWFQTADRTRKAKNIVRDQRCSVSLTVDGSDVVVEGTADKVTDPDTVARIAEIWATRGRWPATPTRTAPASPHHSTLPGWAHRRGSSIQSHPSRRPR